MAATAGKLGGGGGGGTMRGGVGVTEWTYLVKFRKDEARERMLAAMREHGGNAVHAAAALGIPHRSWLRYVRELDLGGDIEAIRAAAAKEGS